MIFYSLSSCSSFSSRSSFSVFSKTATKLLQISETCKKKRQILLKNAVLTYLGVIFLKNSLFIALFVPLWCTKHRLHV